MLNCEIKEGNGIFVKGEGEIKALAIVVKPVQKLFKGLFCVMPNWKDIVNVSSPQAYACVEGIACGGDTGCFKGIHEQYGQVGGENSPHRSTLELLIVLVIEAEEVPSETYFKYLKNEKSRNCMGVWSGVKNAFNDK